MILRKATDVWNRYPIQTGIQAAIPKYLDVFEVQVTILYFAVRAKLKPVAQQKVITYTI